MHRIGPFSNINNSHCLVEYSISQFKTKEEINVIMDKKNEVLLYVIAFLLYREVTIKFIQNLYWVHDQLAVHVLKCKAYANAVMQ